MRAFVLLICAASAVQGRLAHDSPNTLADLLLTVTPLQSFTHHGRVRSAALSRSARAPLASMQLGNKRAQWWTHPNWKWGDGSGEAAVEVVRVRTALATQESRERFMKALLEGRAPTEDAKIALAMMCERLPEEEDKPDRQSWKDTEFGLLRLMKECEFEMDIQKDPLCNGEVTLRAAMNIRIIDAIVKSGLQQKLYLAFEELKFVELGI